MFCTSALPRGRVLRTAVTTSVRRTRPGQHESEPRFPKRIGQRNGGKGMKTRSFPVPIPLPKNSPAHSRAPPAPRRSLPTPPSACRVHWPHAAPFRRLGSRHASAPASQTRGRAARAPARTAPAERGLQSLQYRGFPNPRAVRPPARLRLVGSARNLAAPADLEIGATAGLETCATRTVYERAPAAFAPAFPFVIARRLVHVAAT